MINCNVNFGIGSNLPDRYIPGTIYFIDSDHAIYVAVSETELVQYSGYKNVEVLNETKQDKIEDLESIRNNSMLAASALQDVPTIEFGDIDKLFEF